MSTMRPGGGNFGGTGNFGVQRPSGNFGGTGNFGVQRSVGNLGGGNVGGGNFNIMGQ